MLCAQGVLLLWALSLLLPATLQGLRGMSPALHHLCVTDPLPPERGQGSGTCELGQRSREVAELLVPGRLPSALVCKPRLSFQGQGLPPSRVAGL